MLGQVAASIAVVAVAVFGLGMLGGRVIWRDGVRVVTGCFILFGAPAIANSLLNVSLESVGERLPRQTQAAAHPVPVPNRPPQFDPYAGASVPM
ncbi:MAG: TrbC/VirB2 family protein [Pseudomonadota bacterium]|nr:TrbC/VirB2 family protein [Pseudomonadota bacterium]